MGCVRSGFVLAALGIVFSLAGCGSSEPTKTDDPGEIEQKMQEYQKISHKERSG